MAYCELTANEDYQPVVNGELEFAQGSSEACATITIENDRVFENKEMFYISFSQESSQDRVRISDALGTVTILDDDGKQLLYTMSVIPRPQCEFIDLKCNSNQLISFVQLLCNAWSAKDLIYEY